MKVLIIFIQELDYIFNRLSGELNDEENNY